MIKNSETGEVAMKWVIWQRNPPLVKIDGTGRAYSFIAKQHVFMAWVNPDDVSRLLNQEAKTCNCNNGTYKKAFALSSYLDVLLWETGGREGKLDEKFVEVE